MARDERVVLIGEDLLDPYGGAFKVVKGLSSLYPERVFTSPISEAGFTGIASGMAMRGLRPIVEIMFGDFLMLAADQLLNHITKYRWMYNEQVTVPMVIRAPMGARRGYGPTHSQSIEKHFIGMPGLRVVAPSPFHDPGALLTHAVIHDDEPVIFVENKLMYSRLLKEATSNARLGDLFVRVSADAYPTVTLSYDAFTHADVTLVAYGGMAEIAEAAAEKLLFEDEVYCELVFPSCIQPVALAPILASLARSGHLVVCEEGSQTAGWGAEVVAQVSTKAFDLLQQAPARVAAMEYPIANTRTLEDFILPQVDDIVEAVRATLSKPRTDQLHVVRG